MEKEQPSHEWASDETNLFSEILVDPVNNFMENSKREALKKHSEMIIWFHHCRI